MPIRPNSTPNMDVRHAPFMLPPDFRVYQMNRRLQERVDDGDNQWWDMFATEFFDDKATFTLSFYLEDGPKRYTIGRTLIPRFFRTMFESGVVDMNMILRVPKDFHNSQTNSVTLDCEHATMVMYHAKPVPTKVFAEGHLVADFTPDELMRVRSWHFAIRNHLEYIPKQAPLQNPAVVEDLCKNTTRAGLTSAMLNYLKMCVVIEPMKELMSRQKTYNMDPRDCLRNCLFQKWQRMLNPPADATRTTKRPSRKRKNSSNAGSGGGKKKGFAPSEVMMVGEPTLMGSEFGDEDERMIQRLENNQFEVKASSDSSMNAAELERRAVEEILREAKRGKERSESMGPTGWRKNVIPTTNKRFLHRTIEGAVHSRKVAEKRILSKKKEENKVEEKEKSSCKHGKVMMKNERSSHKAKLYDRNEAKQKHKTEGKKK